jgi:hypothetical protein
MDTLCYAPHHDKSYIRSIFALCALPMMFVMVKSGGIALLILSTCGYTFSEKQTLQETRQYKGVLA